MYTLKIIYKNGRYSFYNKRYDAINAAIRRARYIMEHNLKTAQVEIWETAKLPSMYL